MQLNKWTLLLANEECLKLTLGGRSDPTVTEFKGEKNKGQGVSNYGTETLNSLFN